MLARIAVGERNAMTERFQVSVAAGSLRSAESGSVHFPHRWTPDGVAVRADFTGAHLLHLAAAGCVLNDVYREAAALGITVAGVLVIAEGGFDTDTWASTGIEYAVSVDTPAPDSDVEGLLRRVDEVAEIPRALRSGAPVTRVPGQRRPL